MHPVERGLGLILRVINYFGGGSCVVWGVSSTKKDVCHMHHFLIGESYGGRVELSVQIEVFVRLYA